MWCNQKSVVSPCGQVLSKLGLKKKMSNGLQRPAGVEVYVCCWYTSAAELEAVVYVHEYQRESSLGIEVEEGVELWVKLEVGRMTLASQSAENCAKSGLAQICPFL